MQANFERKTNAVTARFAEEADRGKQQLAQEKEHTARKLEDVLNELELQLADYARRTEQMQMQQAQELGRQQSYYEAVMAEQARSLKTKFSENAAQLQERIKSLEADLIDKGEDFRPVSEGTLKEKYRQLRLLVETTTEPFNLGIKSYTSLGDLDPTEFLVREGKNQLRFLLRSIFWTRLIEGFFSSPYGFGAFGPGEGGSMVFNLYCTWQRLFDADFTGFGPDGPETPENHDFEAFYRNRFANGWRSATFQSIVAALRPREGSRARKRGSASRGSLSSNGLRGIAKVYAANVEKVRADLLEVLGRVCNGAVGDEIEANVAEIVRCASELAADFAAHQAKVCFGQMPMRGDSVTIGAEFVDCEDGDTSRRGAETVDLAVSPSLFIIGDGRNDLITPVCLLPGEIFSSRS
ncbi:hypothetical protein B0T24DRAFT_523904 [Lasiosphaeria ovina]|uniref:Uncharacterized protein n=1 Tax=Lasiosphaeria ovina TaxID=92902 RepID=A0AAE0NAK7_9PEZI|nr:hypothetical protein B0T24DRAFT_523904 [Lasiosphaeria ovina]